MKTQKNNQETGNNLVAKVFLFGSAVIISAVLIGKTTSAQISQNPMSNCNLYGEQTSLVVGQSSDTKEADAAAEIINAEVIAQLNHQDQTAMQDYEMEEPTTSATEMIESPSLISTEIALEKAMEYNPVKFVEAELEMEKANFINDEVLETETAHLIEVLTDESQYNAGKFVEAEIEQEIENVKNNETLNESAEAPTASIADQEISKYAEEVIVSVDNWTNNAGYFTEAKQITANGADEEVAKYAKNTILKIETEGTQVAENKLSAKYKFNSPKA